MFWPIVLCHAGTSRPYLYSLCTSSVPRTPVHQIVESAERVCGTWFIWCRSETAYLFVFFMWNNTFFYGLPSRGISGRHKWVGLNILRVRNETSRDVRRCELDKCIMDGMVHAEYAPRTHFTHSSQNVKAPSIFQHICCWKRERTCLG